MLLQLLEIRYQHDIDWSCRSCTAFYIVWFNWSIHLIKAELLLPTVTQQVNFGQSQHWKHEMFMPYVLHYYCYLISLLLSSLLLSSFLPMNWGKYPNPFGKVKKLGKAWKTQSNFLGIKVLKKNSGRIFTLLFKLMIL